MLLALLLVVPLSVPAAPSYAEDGTCIHVDVSVSAGGELLSKGPQIANDGGFGHAGTGQTFTFQARKSTVKQGLRLLGHRALLRTGDARARMIAVGTARPDVSRMAMRRCVAQRRQAAGTGSRQVRGRWPLLGRF
jgi:hypothetical protein